MFKYTLNDNLMVSYVQVTHAMHMGPLKDTHQ